MTHPTPIPAPTPECAAFEPLLPLLATDTLTLGEATATRQHIARCPWCQAQRESYDTFEAALRRHYGSQVSDGPLITLEGVIRADEEVDEPDDISQLVLEVSSVAPATPRTSWKRWRPKRFAEIAAVVVVGLLAATLLIGRFGPLNGLPFNQQPLKSSAGAVVFTHSVSWGKLQINGQAIDVTSDGNKPLYLPRGQNALSYYAPPFPVLTCTISAPAAKNDTCPIYSDQESNPGFPSFPGRIVNLEVTPDRLSATQRDALLRAVQQQLNTLSAQVTIQPGDHYSTPEGRYLTADRTFTMTLNYHVTADGLGLVVYGCLPFCKNVPENVWTISPSFGWDYIDEYGKPETVLQGPAGNSSQSDTTMGMILQWNGAWQVSFPDGTVSSTMCSLISDIMTNIMSSRADSGSTSGIGCSGSSLATYVGTLFELSGSKNTDGSQEITGYVLYRGGAMIAVDGAAHELAPWMPLASAHELAIAYQLRMNG